ncbi:A24 family peptidase [Acetobacter estunensis]|uniref:prepilin peptidase n=1 Tax=Acetobacter estunensis TaxID=104097 RepID=UPI001C2DCF52|nr:A24 family peptidase [Acetobacter estunensis]
MLYNLFIVLASLSLFYAAGTDIYRRSIYNWTVLVVFFMSLGVAVIRGDALCSLLVTVSLAPFLYILWRCHLFGGGDVKLMIGLIPIVPISGLLSLFLSIAVAGSVVAGMCLAWHWIKFVTGWGSIGDQTVPYGVAIAAGTFINLYHF